MSHTNPIALIVDDEPDICELIKMTLARMDVTCDTSTNLNDAMSLLDRQQYDICITDLRLKSDSGLDLIKHIHADHPQTPVAMITAHGNIEAAVDALKAGAFDFVSKPVSIDGLRDLVTAALKLKVQPAAEQNQQPASDQLVGDSPVMVKLRKQINKVARTRTPVLISGESGTGREGRPANSPGERTSRWSLSTCELWGHS